MPLNTAIRHLKSGNWQKAHAVVQNDAEGTAGENADYLWVYDRAGKPCVRCKATIKRSVLQGRATYYCPTCQTP